MTRYVMVIDKRRCIGCQSCTVACRTWNDLPLDIVYNPVVTEGTQGTWPNVHRDWTPLLCMHCANPECVPCCPTGASQQDEDGTVWIDSKKCMACKVCVNACPYGMRDASHLEPRLHRFVRKCTFCAHRIAEGEAPACCETCIGDARYFGDLNDPSSKVAQLAASPRAFRLREELGTNPSVYYLK